MFTGIIENLGTIDALQLTGGGGRVAVEAPALSGKLSVSSSIAVNGCCLTIVTVDGNKFSADLSLETLQKTSFRSLKPGASVNLEQPLTAGEEFGGHFVLGHVDGVGRVTELTPHGNGWRYAVEVPAEIARYIVPKGSITIDGISLTIANWHDRLAEIAVIPFTFAQTNIHDRKPGDLVNLEADILGKYIDGYLTAREAGKPASSLSIENLVEHGF